MTKGITKVIIIFLGGIMGMLFIFALFRQVINEYTSIHIDIINLNVFYDYLQGFNPKPIIESIQQAFNDISDYLAMFKDFTFVDALTVLPKAVVLMLKLSGCVIKLIWGVIDIILFILGFIPYLFKGAI